ncbi:MAG: DUF4386 family protein [Myxococcota bacterium]|nr:DUF4386 family protein [Myxococcota bacterium]
MDIRIGRGVGFAALSLVFIAPFSLLYVPEQTLRTGDLAGTAELQVVEQALVRWGLAGELAVVGIELFLLSLLWLLLRRESPVGGAILLSSRLAMTVLQSAGVIAGWAALQSFTQGWLEVGGGLLALKSSGMLVWQGIFALHCAVLAVVLWRRADSPRWMAVGMGITALAYLAIGVGPLLADSPLWTHSALSGLAMGELPFYLWLAFRRAPKSPAQV